MNTKLHAVNEADDRQIRIFLTRGQVSDQTGATVHLRKLAQGKVTAGRQASCCRLAQRLAERQGAKALLPGQEVWLEGLPHDK